MKQKLLRAIEISAIGLPCCRSRLRPLLNHRKAFGLNRRLAGRRRWCAYFEDAEAKKVARAEKLEIGDDQIGQILQNETLVRLTVRTLFVADRGYLIFRSEIPRTRG